jgi:glycerol-3-phosphate acyltransferase PlsY
MWNGSLAATAAYLLGSIPFGYLFYWFRAGKDIRATGSGNIGATNVFRAAGWLPALATFALDVGKGYAAIVLARRLGESSDEIAAVAIVFVLIGHCFPVFIHFRGGKGVATGLGTFLAVSPVATLICVCFFALHVAMFGYVSLASILAVAVFPALLLMMGGYSPPVLIAAFAAAILIVLRHRGNIHRLRTGSEPSVFGRK